jgi:hypothetical protein
VGTLRNNARSLWGDVISPAQALDADLIDTTTGQSSIFVSLDDSSCSNYWQRPGSPVFAYGNGARYLVGLTQFATQGTCAAAATDLTQFAEWIQRETGIANVF